MRYIDLITAIMNNSNSTKKWYVLYTKPGCEKKVAGLLTRRQVENYCPLKRNLTRKKKIMLEPVLNSYVFVYINDADMVNIRMTESVVNFVYWLGKPAEIQDAEIEIMKRFLNEHNNVSMEKLPLNSNGMVRLIEGAQANNKSIMVSVKNKTVKVILPSLGYMLLAELEQSNVEIITAANHSYTIVEKFQFAI